MNEIVVFNWTVTLHADGTALAENHLTGDMLELDAAEAAELKGTARPEHDTASIRCTPPR
jgi:hypothetical protein